MRGIASQESPSNPYVLRVNSNALHSAYAELKAGHSHVMLNISQQPNTLKALLKPFKKTWADATPSTPAHPVYALPAGIDPKGFSRDDMPLNWLDLLIKTINSSSSIKTVSINAAYLKFNKAGSTSERDYTGLGAEDEEEGEATGPESAPQQKRLSDEEIEAEVKKAFAHVTPDALNQRAQAAFDKLMVNTEQCRKFVKKHKLLPDIESELAEHQEYLDSLPAERRAKAESVEARRKRLEATPVDMKKLKDKLLEIEQADYESAKAAKRQYLKTIIPASSSALHELFSPKKETQIGGAASSGGAAGGAGHIASETALLNKEDFLNFVIALSKLQKKGANSKFTIEAAPDAPLLLSLYLDHSDLLSGNIQFILTECRFNFLSLHNNEHPVKTEILSKPSGNQDHRLMFVAKVPEDYLNERWVINPVDVIKLGENLQSAARQSSMARGLSIFSPSISRASTLSRPSVSRHDEPAYTHWDFSILLTDPDSTKLESLPFASGTCSVIIKNRIVQDSLPVYDKGHLAELIETVYRFGQLPSLSKFEAVKEQVRLQTRTARLINYAELTLSDAEKIAEASAQLQHLLNSGIKIVDMPNRDEFKIWPKEVQEIVQQKAKAITRVIELRAQLSSQPFEQRKYHTITSVPGFEHLPEADQAKLREHIHINSKAQSILLELLRGAPKKEWEKFYKSTEFKSLAQSDQDRIKELANQPPASTLPSGAAAPAPATVPVRLVHAETARPATAQAASTASAIARAPAAMPVAAPAISTAAASAPRAAAPASAAPQGLLAQIKQKKQLKPATTNDRSAPALKAPARAQAAAAGTGLGKAAPTVSMASAAAAAVAKRAAGPGVAAASAPARARPATPVATASTALLNPEERRAAATPRKVLNLDNDPRGYCCLPGILDRNTGGLACLPWCCAASEADKAEMGYVNPSPTGMGK